MSAINRSVPAIKTHEGAIAKHINPEMQLRRSVLSCLLWEKEFYEDGQEIADRIIETANRCPSEIVAGIAYEARHVHGLRHVPLLLLLSLLPRKDHPKGFSVKNTIAQVIRRPDEMMELLAMYWMKGKRPLDKSLQRGLALAFAKFNEYSLAKYNQDNAIKLRDVMFITHPKPKNEEQAVLFKKVAEKTLKTPDTWEVAISACGNDNEKKRVQWTRLLENTLNDEDKNRDGKLGYMALLRNLRNMVNSGVHRELITRAIEKRYNADLVFPFRYLAAARVVPALEPAIDRALLQSVGQSKILPGTTLILVDVSGSMTSPLSARSDLSRMDAAAALASLVNCQDFRVFSFSDRFLEVPARKGMAGIDAIIRSQRHSGTELADAILQANKIKHDRLIVITDEQANGVHHSSALRGRTGGIPNPVSEKAYMVNVASARNGVGYGSWIHLDGFSEGIIRYIYAIEGIN